ncbi:hypothetical protein [Pseudoalteromonas sp. 1_2015MBL_MicDiv]|uniref:hypothetical protein n=1 Tax=Pseudoalteromonas sp. 1_2015MBL_MicDiv TaxID=1720343 RepID=UPI000BBEBAB1|nr:hypothetical protein [Pseudoalteromonas sp. 1_2015MBL_MicDiv]ATG76503.1 hypothetical protein AOR04_02520 [Pseudoalteromonas sp. 1_2015MBL_MicDiv]
MYFDVKKRKIISFFSLVFSSLGFTSGILLVRAFSNHESLSQVINLQSIVVFSSFILQFGLRAALRGHIYNGRIRLAQLSERSLHYILALCSILVFFIEYLYGLYFYFCLSSLIALVTLRLTINVAKNNFLSIFKFSALNFFVAIVGSVCILIFDEIEYANITIELFSLLIIIFTVKLNSFFYCLKYKTSLLKVYFDAQSFQLGSCVIALFIFLLSQTAIVQFSNSNQLSAYSDALIVSGFLVLLLGKLLLLFERKLYQENAKHLRFFIIMILSQTILASFFSLILSKVYSVSFLISFTVVFILLSRIPIGYIVQYEKENRFLLNVVSGLFFIGYICFYMFGFKSLDITLHILPVIIFMLFGLFLFWRARNYD